MANLFYYLIKNYGHTKTLAFLAPVCVTQKTLFLKLTLSSLLRCNYHLIYNWLAVSTLFDNLIKEELEQDPEAVKPDLESILEGSDTDTQPPLDWIAAYTEWLDATHATSPLGHAFFNGKHFDMGDVRSFCISL